MLDYYQCSRSDATYCMCVSSIGLRLQIHHLIELLPPQHWSVNPNTLPLLIFAIFLCLRSLLSSSLFSLWLSLKWSLFFSVLSLLVVILSLIPAQSFFVCGSHQWMLFIPSSAYSSYSCYCQFAAGGPDTHTCEHRQLCGNLLFTQTAAFLEHFLWIPVLGEKKWIAVSGEYFNCFQIFLHLKLVIGD